MSRGSDREGGLGGGDRARSAAVVEPEGDRCEVGVAGELVEVGGVGAVEAEDADHIDDPVADPGVDVGDVGIGQQSGTGFLDLGCRIGQVSRVDLDPFEQAAQRGSGRCQVAFGVPQSWQDAKRHVTQRGSADVTVEPGTAVDEVLVFADVTVVVEVRFWAVEVRESRDVG